MPLIITLAHQKGGVGKSTLATNLRGYFTGGGNKTALVDIDPQGSLTKLVRTFADQEGREPENMFARESFREYAELKTLLEPYDIVIVDTPPYLSEELEHVLSMSDLVIVPCKASPLDYFAIGDTLDLVREAQIKNPKLLAAVVFNMVIAGTEFTGDIRRQIEKTEFPVLTAEVGNRVAFMRSLVSANMVSGSDNLKAAQEIESLGLEIISLLHKNYGN